MNSSITASEASRTSGSTPLVAALVFIALVVAAIGSLGAPLITAVAQDYRVPLTAAQWTLTITLLSGAISGPLLGRLGSDRRRRSVVLATLVIVVAGSAATMVQGSFVLLLVGRAAQGVGLGLPVLMMATARQHLGERASSTIAMLSVASTVGVGVGYPVAGLLAQLSGAHTAYLLGLVIAAAALITAIVAVPRDTSEAPPDGAVDWVGAALLSLGLVSVLLVTSETSLWTSNPLAMGVILAAGILGLIGWVAVERRVQRPLVDLHALRHPAVASANLIMGVSGIAMYLLFTLITRYVQTPPQAGYGYGLTDFEAGLVLVPFSALGFLAGRVVPHLQQRLGPFPMLAVSGVVVTVACCLFATTRTLGVIWPIAAMGVLGFGVGGVSATIPQAILAVTPAKETAAAMSINQVVRTVGFSIGSALGGLLLSAYTPTGDFAPTGLGYTTAAWVAAVFAVVSIGLASSIEAFSRRRNPRTTEQS